MLNLHHTAVDPATFSLDYRLDLMSSLLYGVIRVDHDVVVGWQLQQFRFCIGGPAAERRLVVEAAFA